MPGVHIGLRDLYYAILTKDDSTGVTYNTPVKIAGAIDVKINPKSETLALYGDDGPTETATTLGVIEVEIDVKDIGLDDQAALLGHTVTGGVIYKKSTDVQPYVALGFKTLKSNGKYRYVWLYKGRFDFQDNEYKTKEDKINFQTAKLKGMFIRRDNDNAWQKIADEDHPNYVASIGTNWFNAVDTADTTPPTISSVAPANNATAVAATTSITWTFSEAIMASTVIPANFVVQKSDGSAQVAGTLSLDATKTIVTFTPSANLAATTQYMATVTTGVKDLYGNALASAYSTRFTTA